MNAFDFRDPAHDDAQLVWPILRPVYVALLAAFFDLEQAYPSQAQTCRRLAHEVRDLMIEAEVGVLNATPERKIDAAIREAGAADNG